jgi:molybdopterin molybdotransferase
MQELSTNISVEEAVAAYSRIQPVAPRRIPLFEANGLRVAEDVIVKRQVPAVAIAAHDGWAIAAASTAGATRRKPAPLGGPAVQIDSGAPLPHGADAVLPPADVRSRLRGPAAVRPVQAGEGVTQAGGDAAACSVLVREGTRITFAVAVACARCGIMDVLVRRPVVDIIFNTAGYTRPRDQWIGVIASAIRGSGCEIGAIQFTAGDATLLSEALLGSSADIITIVGGTGNGPGDCTMETIAAIGEVVFHGIRLSPGATAGFGIVAGKPVFASPGGLSDMIAVNIVLSWPFARQAFGRPPLTPPFMRERLAAGIPASPRGSRLIFARHDRGAITPYLDDRLSPSVLAQANAAIFIPEGSRHRRKGEQVKFLRLGTSM